MDSFVFIFPSDPINVSQLDIEYQDEYQVAKKLGRVALIDNLALFENQQINIAPKIQEDDCIVYRGWMLAPNQYQKLAEYVRQKGARLVTSFDDYCAAHLLPNWQDKVSEYLTKTEWTDDISERGLIDLLKKFSGAVTIKDFVKSRKHEWEEACFIPNVVDTKHALKVINTFIERQGSQFVGGLVMRQFQELHAIGQHPQSQMPIFEEYRVFYWEGSPFRIIDYWKNGDVKFSDQDWNLIVECGHKINLPFFTIDYARKQDGMLMIMEVGDGQVSGLQDSDVEEFYQSLQIAILESPFS